MEKEGQRRSKRYYWNDARDNKKIPKTWRLAQEKNPKPGQLMALMRRSSLEPDPLFAQLTETKNHQEAHARLHAEWYAGNAGVVPRPGNAATRPVALTGAVRPFGGVYS